MTAPVEADKELDKILAGILKFINSNGRDGLDIYGARERLLAWRDKAVADFILSDDFKNAGGQLRKVRPELVGIQDRLTQLNGAKDD